MDERFDWAVLQLAAHQIRERNHREIERAIDRIKKPKSATDDWFRREWYRAAAQRRQRILVSEPGQGNEESPQARRWQP